MLNSLKKKQKKALALILSFTIVFTSFGGTGFVFAADVPDVELPELEIANVEELTGGTTQVLYRDEVYKGVEANGEDPEKYYTTYREINLKDPRIFNFEYVVDAKTDC